MQGYCRSAQQTQSTALFTCFQRSLLQQVTWYRGELAPKAHGAAVLQFSFRPVHRRVDQGEEGPEQCALFQLLHPHLLQDQEGRHEPQDVSTGPRPCRTHSTRGRFQHHWAESNNHHHSTTRVQQVLTQGIDAFALQEHVGKKVSVEI